MGASYSTSSPEPMERVLAAYQGAVGPIIQNIASMTPSAALSQTQAANQTVNPGSQQVLGMNALNLQQLQRYALPEAQVGQQIANSNALAGARTNLAQLTGPGAQVASAAEALQSRLSPAYAASKNLLGSINLNGLSPGEANAVERATNQTQTATGNLGLVNPTNTISNAMNFGGAFNNKLGVMSNAINTASNAAGGFSPINAALGQPATSTGGNFGTGQFTNTGPNAAASSSGNVFNFGSGLLGNMSSMNNTAMNAGASMANATSPASYLGAACCFIFLEAYKGKLPKCVRRGRDLYYHSNIDIAAGYRRMASWLVPMMQCNEFVRSLVWSVMVSPITQHLEHPKKGWRKTVTHFWLRLWAITGKNHWESEYNNLVQYV